MRIINFIFITIISFILLLLLPSKIYAQTIFSDDFEAPESQQWIVPRNTCNTNWVYNTGEYGITISSPCVTETLPQNLVIPNNISYSFEVEITFPSSIYMDRNFVFKYKDNLNWYGIHTYGNSVYFQKVVNGTEYFLPNRIINYSFVPDKKYKFKINIYNNNIYQVIIDDKLISTIQDSLPYIANYSAGLQASAGGTQNSEVWFDNVVITQIPDTTPTPTATSSPTNSPTPTATPTITPTPTPSFPSLIVEDLKQYDPRWKDEIYGNTDRTIENFGCALTSAAMVLRYHGHDIYPGALNTWLKSQPDGYIRNGLVNWLAVSRYTKLHDSDSSPTLEYKRYNSSYQTLENEITQKRPAILKENGHFIVAKSILQDTFGINDPGYSNRPTLESYDGIFLNINSYIPTHSDLSYMMFVYNSAINVELFDSNNNQVELEYYEEDQLISILNPGLKWDVVLSSAYLRKPTSGVYTLKVTGNDPTYQLDAYLYDTFGNVIFRQLYDSVLPGGTNIYTINFTENKSIQNRFEYILGYFQDSYLNGYIKNKGIYNMIKVQLGLYEKKRDIKIIKLIIKQVELFTSKWITPEFSSRFLSDLNSLLS